MEKSIIINSFQGGLSNTKTIGQSGSFYDSKSIDYRKNPEFVTLNRLVSEDTTFITTAKPNAIGITNYYGGTVLMDNVNLYCADGKVYENFINASDQNASECYYIGVNKPIQNLANINGYNYMLCEDRIERFVNRVYDTIIPSNIFSSGWTGANWSTGIHTPGATTSYTQSTPIVAVTGARYHIIVQVQSQTVGTCTVSIGGATSSNLSVGRNDIYLTTSNTTGIAFNPSSTSDIILFFVRVDRVSTLASPNGLGVDASYKTLTTTGVTKRPFINYYGDLLFGNGTSVARLNKDTTLVEFSTTQEGPVIGGLDGTVYAITQIATNIYVWCNNGGSTNIYLWDGLSSRPTQKIIVADRPVINVALLSNQHYWWSQKGVMSQKFVHVGQDLQNQVIVKSDIPRDPTAGPYDQDRLALYGEQTNAIETFGDYIFLPGYGKIYSFGSYYPGMAKSFNKEFTFNGSECTAMLTTSNPGDVQYINIVTDYYMLTTYKRGSSYYVGTIDFRDWNGGYASTGYVDTMEYSEGNAGVVKNTKKMIVPFMLTDANCSINIYLNIDQTGFVLQKTINSTDYGTGFNTAEIPVSYKWHTLQARYELVTASSSVSPRLYLGQNIVSEITELYKSSTYGR